MFCLGDFFGIFALEYFDPDSNFAFSYHFVDHKFLQTSRTPQKLQIRAFSTKLTHVDEQGKAAMVNVINKSHTKRKATACGHVNVGAEITSLIRSNLMKKGDVLSIAQIAGIMGAKNTPNLIPLTHHIPLSSVKVDLKLNEEENRVEIYATIECFWNTGCEIEALTAVSISALTVYDMCKAVSHDISITNIQLMEKSGGKSDFKRPN